MRRPVSNYSEALPWSRALATRWRGLDHLVKKVQTSQIKYTKAQIQACLRVRLQITSDIKINSGG